MKKAWVILCMITILFCTNMQVFAGTNDPSLTVDNVVAEAGESVDVPIRISNNTGICGAIITINYDEKLELTGISSGDAFSSMSLTKPGDLSANPVNLVWDSMEADYTNGTIVVLRFTAPKESGVYSVSASFEEGDVVDEDLNPVPLNIVNGSIEIAEQSPIVCPFSDVKEGDWFYDSAIYVYRNGIMTGIDHDSFAPFDSLLRAQFAVMIYRLENEPEVTYSNRYPDVPKGTWFTDAVMWVSENGIITGYNDGKFGTADNITREQIATILYRYVKYKNYEANETASISSFKDGAAVSPYATEAMKWAVAIEMITGKENGTKLAPQDPANRAECSKIFMKFMEEYKSY